MIDHTEPSRSRPKYGLADGLRRLISAIASPPPEAFPSRP
jgi:hypothetical protein